MGLFSRRRARAADGAPDAPSPRQAQQATLAHLRDFVATRVGVEAYVEPETNVTQTTLMLIATTGEWTRRKVPGAKEAYELARNLGIPVYDVHRTGYPQRMRDWNASQRVTRRAPEA
ncbi:MAG TPA: oxidoreductase [Cellulomonas sp.]|uniref:oxidoreductase n=1 Tax=Cellulomonas sp. TaxID=40001 RepID=UPI002E322FCD|nr:oxidoreductase [Cellulomonas sp.]HEX5332709.1 oxidoreductase [Cellulomonas sp.]